MNTKIESYFRDIAGIYMDYHIEIGQDAHGPRETLDAINKTAARKLAREACRDNPGERVAVSFIRASDGQKVFFNPDGNHSLNGKDWNIYNVPGKRMTSAELKTLRESLGLSVSWLAAQVGVNERTVNYWESGKTSVPAKVAGLVLGLENAAKKDL
jgi:DNA-binding XRE family transcriptional regulator